MSKWRKKPVVVEAVQLRWNNWDEMCEFAGVGEPPKPHGCYIDGDGNATDNATNVIGMRIPALEGVMVASQGDWVIRGINGELYPCKPDIFEKTYEPAEDGPTEDFKAGFRVGMGEPDFKASAFVVLRSLCCFDDPKDDQILASDIEMIAKSLHAAYNRGWQDGCDRGMRDADLKRNP